MVYDFYFESLRRASRRREPANVGEEDSDQDEIDDENEDEEDDVEEDSANELNESDDAETEEQDGDDSDADHESSSDSDSGEENHAAAAIPFELRRRTPIPGSSDPRDKVQHSDYRDEFVVDQRGNLHARLPRLTCASRQLLAETLRFNFDADYKFLVHVKEFRIRPFFEHHGVFILLADICGIDAMTETNTMIILHGGHELTREKERDDLRWWLRMYWYNSFPLFDTHLEIMFRHSPSPTGGKSYGHADSHPTYQTKADYQRKCLGIVEYLRFLHDADAAKWKELASSFLDGWAELQYNRLPQGRGPARQNHRYLRTPIKKLPPKTYTEFVEPVLEAVVAVVGPGSMEHKKPWEFAIAELVRDTYRRTKLAAEQSLGSRFADAERRHLEMSLPKFG